MIVRKRVLLWLIPILILFAELLIGCGEPAVIATNGTTDVIHVVAAENFYGNVVSQIGGPYVSVTSVLSNPNTDPHEFTSNARTALLVSTADLVIENGLGYDSWMGRLLSTQGNPRRIILNAGAIAPHLLPDNPHVWYDVNNMQVIAQAIAHALTQLDNSHAALFERNVQTFAASLQPIRQRLATIKQHYANTPVALTETIYLYQTQQEGLQVLTPPAFMKAIAEGDDPPVDALIAITDEVQQRQVHVLIFNIQTITPVTTLVEQKAKAQHIPLVAVSETMPTHQTYQTWMQAQLDALETALQEGH